MKMYYYGSKNPNLKGLKIADFSNQKIYMTVNRMCALMYASYDFVNLFIDTPSGLKFLNIYPDLFKRMYKDTIGYIYSVELDEENFHSDAPLGKKPVSELYYISKDVIFDNKEIVNVYDEFMKIKDEGDFEILDIKDIPKDYINDLKKYYQNRFLHNDMSKEEIEYFNKYLPELFEN